MKKVYYVFFYLNIFVKTNIIYKKYLKEESEVLFMALVKCPECGRKEVSDSALSCPHCGYNIKLHFEKLKTEQLLLLNEDANKEKVTKDESNNGKDYTTSELQQNDLKISDEYNLSTGENYNNNCVTEGIEYKNSNYDAQQNIKKTPHLKKIHKHNGKQIAIIVTGIVLLIIIFMISKLILIPMYEYNRALHYMKEENYKNAIDMLEKIPNYKNVDQILNECKYNDAKNIIVNNVVEQLDDAIQYLNTVNSTQEITDLIEKGNYQLAYLDYTNGEYKEALNRIETLHMNLEVSDLRLKCLWELISELYSVNKYEEVLLYFDMVGNVDLLGVNSYNANKILKESILMYARECYENGDFSTAALYYKKMDSLDDDDTLKYKQSCLLEKLQGKWLIEGQFQGYEFIGWDTIYYQDLTDYLGNLKNPKITERSNDLKDSWLYKNENTLIHKGSYLKIILRSSNTMYMGTDEDNALIYHKVSEFHGTIEEPKDPRVGMSASEVRESSWGEPDHINKTTYSWGTKEQWCYSGYRYIYLENGIVTAISE